MLKFMIPACFKRTYVIPACFPYSKINLKLSAEVFSLDNVNGIF